MSSDTKTMKESTAIFLLLLCSFIWGSTFIFQSEAADLIGPGMYNGIRFLIGFVVLSPMWINIANKKKADRTYFPRLLKSGAICGAFLAAASIVQQAGMAWTTASKAGFLTSLYTLFVPVFSIISGKRVGLKLWICVAVGVVGAFFLSLSNGMGDINRGDALMLGCAVLFAFHVMAVEKFVKGFEGIDLSSFQFLFAGIYCLIFGLCTESFSFSMVKDALVPILYAGVFSCGVAYTLQVVGQKYVVASKATLAMSLENAWAAVGGVVVLHESLNGMELLGCVLLFAAVIISQLIDAK